VTNIFPTVGGSGVVNKQSYKLFLKYETNNEDIKV